MNQTNNLIKKVKYKASLVFEEEEYNDFIKLLKLKDYQTVRQNLNTKINFSEDENELLVFKEIEDLVFKISL